MSFGRIARRIVVGLVAVAVVSSGLWWASTYGPLAGCIAEGPNVLPSGAPSGQGIEGVSAEGKQLVWGHAGDRIEELVGQDWFNPDDPNDIRVATISIHGHPGVLFALSPDINGGQVQLAFSWNNGSCDQTVLLVPGTSIERAEAYAARF
jgi:hypothetical protein